MKKLTYLFAFFALSFGLSINAQTSIDDLTDGHTFNTNEQHSIILGHNNILATQSNANKNLGLGMYVLQDLTTGDSNVVYGWGSGRNITTGQNNISMGRESSKLLESGSNNTFLGTAAGDIVTGGSNNVFIGQGADADSAASSGRIAIGKGVTNSADNTAVIGPSTLTKAYFGSETYAATLYAAGINLENDETITNSTNGTVVVSGNLTVSSDMRLKDNIQPLGDTMVNILKLDAKSYTREGREEIGLIAQDVQNVYPELVVEDGNGMLAVNYQALSAILINGIKDQEARIQKLELLVKLLLEDK